MANVQLFSAEVHIRFLYSFCYSHVSCVFFQNHSTQTENEELLQELFSKKRCSVTKEQDGKDGPKASQVKASRYKSEIER